MTVAQVESGFTKILWVCESGKRKVPIRYGEGGASFQNRDPPDFPEPRMNERRYARQFLKLET